MGGTVLWSGNFAVACTPERVRSFAAAITTTAPVEPLAVPPTFPITWLTDPLVTDGVRGALAGQTGGPSGALVHIGQSFHYFRPLAIGASYRLSIDVTTDRHPDAFMLRGEIADASGTVATLAGEFVLSQALPS